MAFGRKTIVYHFTTAVFLLLITVATAEPKEACDYDCSNTSTNKTAMNPLLLRNNSEVIEKTNYTSQIMETTVELPKEYNQQLFEKSQNLESQASNESAGSEVKPGKDETRREPVLQGPPESLGASGNHGLSGSLVSQEPQRESGSTESRVETRSTESRGVPGSADSRGVLESTKQQRETGSTDPRGESVTTEPRGEQGTTEPQGETESTESQGEIESTESQAETGSIELRGVPGLTEQQEEPDSTRHYPPVINNCFNLNPIPDGEIEFQNPNPGKHPEWIKVDSPDVQFPVGTVLRYSCNPGYVLGGNETLSCLPTGFWSSTTPVCVEGCGSPRTDYPIGNVTVTLPGEFPWIVILYDEGNHKRCKGVLLDKRTVLTTARCLSIFTLDCLVFGKYYQHYTDTRGEEVRYKFQTIIHPEFNITGTEDNDIGLIKLASDLLYTQLISPICLPTPETTAVNFAKGSQGIATTYIYRRTPLMKYRIEVQSDDSCMEIAYEERKSNELGPHMFYGRSPDEWFWSGTPLIFYDKKTNRYVVEGLFNLIFGRDRTSRCYVVTKVSPFLHWIEKNRYQI